MVLTLFWTSFKSCKARLWPNSENYQSYIKNEQAKKLVTKNNIEYIEDRCTKMEYQKHFLKIRQAFPVLQD